MEFLIAGLLVINLAVTLVSGQLLEREARRHFCELKELLAETNGSLSGVGVSQSEMTCTMAKMYERYRTDMEKLLTEEEVTAGAFRMVFEKVEALPSRQDTVEAFGRLERLLEKDSSRGDDENRQSRDIEEGITNLLSYSVGKSRGIEP